MADTSRSRKKKNDDVREFRLEGFGLFFSIAALAVLMGGSFWAGRQWERRQADPSGLPGDARLTEANVAADALKPPADVDSEMTIFDRADGTVAEPEREVAAEREEPSRNVRRAVEQAVVEDRSAPFFVQVFAGRDEATATQLIDRLEGAGYRVRLFTEPDGQGTLYKVRVGGYPERDSARSAASRLQGAGHSGAWVTEVR